MPESKRSFCSDVFPHIIPPYCPPGSVCVNTTKCYDEDLDPKGENYDGCAKTTVSGRTCQVGIWFKTLGLDYFATFVSRHGPLQPPTTIASHTLTPTTVAIQISTLAHGMSCIRKLMSLKSQVLLAQHFRCYTTDPDKRWENCPDLTCTKGDSRAK